MQGQVEALGNGHADPEPADTSLLLDAPLEAEEPAEAASAPPPGATMMSREARQLFAAGDGAAGLAAWKVSMSDMLFTAVSYNISSTWRQGCCSLQAVLPQELC